MTIMKKKSKENLQNEKIVSFLYGEISYKKKRCKSCYIIVSKIAYKLLVWISDINNVKTLDKLCLGYQNLELRSRKMVS